MLTRAASLAPTLALLAALAGCGSGAGDGKSAPLTEQEGLEQFFASIDDFKEVPETFGRAFAAGSAPPPATLRLYRKYSFQMDGKPTVRGEEAVVTVKVLEKDREVATKEWVAVKDGAGWKLKSAPLP